MADPKGFLSTPRETPARRPVEVRLRTGARCTSRSRPVGWNGRQALVQQLRPAHFQVPQLDKQVTGSGLASLWLLCFYTRLGTLPVRVNTNRIAL
jgi:hypothetical protein